MLKLRAGPGCAARQSCLQASRCTCECPAVTLLLVMLNRFWFFFLQVQDAPDSAPFLGR